MKASSKLLSTYLSKFSNKRDSGFTLIEALVVMIVLGILTAIAAPSWESFTLNQKLNTAQGEIFRALEEAKSISKRTQTAHQVSFRANTVDSALQYVINSVESVPTTINQPYWDSLPWKNVKTDSYTSVISMRGVSVPPAVPFSSSLNYPTFAFSDPLSEGSSTSYVVKRIRFDSKGGLNAKEKLNPYLVLRISSDRVARRCVTVTTLLGATRSLREGENACPQKPN